MSKKTIMKVIRSKKNLKWRKKKTGKRKLIKLIKRVARKSGELKFYTDTVAQTLTPTVTATGYLLPLCQGFTRGFEGVDVIGDQCILRGITLRVNFNTFITTANFSKAYNHVLWGRILLIELRKNCDLTEARTYLNSSPVSPAPNNVISNTFHQFFKIHKQKDVVCTYHSNGDGTAVIYDSWTNGPLNFWIKRRIKSGRKLQFRRDAPTIDEPINCQFWLYSIFQVPTGGTPAPIVTVEERGTYLVSYYDP